MSTNAPLDRERAGDRESAEPERPAVSVAGLDKTYGSGADAVHAVEDVSFDIESGTVVGLLGPNGAGKTTTIKAILGLVVPTAGTVTVDGVDVHAEPRTATGASARCSKARGTSIGSSPCERTSNSSRHSAAGGPAR